MKEFEDWVIVNVSLKNKKINLDVLGTFSSMVGAIQEARSFGEDFTTSILRKDVYELLTEAVPSSVRL